MIFCYFYIGLVDDVYFDIAIDWGACKKDKGDGGIIVEEATAILSDGTMLRLSKGWAASLLFLLKALDGLF